MNALAVAVLIVASAVGGAIIWHLALMFHKSRKLASFGWVYLAPVHRPEQNRHYWKVRAPWDRGAVKPHWEFEFRHDPDRGHALFCTWCGHLKSFGSDIDAVTAKDGKPSQIQLAMEQHVKDMQTVGLL